MSKALNFGKIKSSLTVIIYFILTLAIASDILRIPGTTLTFFRLSIPIAVFIIALYPKWFRRLVVTSLIFVFINTIWNIIFFKVYRPELLFDLTEYVKYTILYFCIFLIVLLIAILKEQEGKQFEIKFGNWLCFIGLVFGVVLFLSGVFPAFFEALSIDNPNNYGCYLAAILPIYLIKMQKEKRKEYLLIVVCFFILLYINDCKLSLLGCLIQLALLFCVSTKGTKVSFITRRLIAPVLVLFMAILIVLLNPTINGYPLQGIISEPVTRVLTNNPYSFYTTSVSYRTNTTLFALNIVGEMKGIGFGAGNLGLALKQEFPDLNPSYLQALNASRLSLHNSWLEFMCDWGIIGILLLLIPFFYAVKKYFAKNVLHPIEKLNVIFILSFPLWVIGPSGVYTMYFLFCIIVYIFIATKTFEKCNTVDI